MGEVVRIRAAKEPHLFYRTRRLLPGDEIDVPRGIASIFTKLGYATVAGQETQPYVPPPAPSIEGDDLSVLRALAKSKGLKVDGRWSVKRLKSEIERRK